MPMQMDMQSVHCDTLIMLRTTRQSTRRLFRLAPTSEICCRNGHSSTLWCLVPEVCLRRGLILANGAEIGPEISAAATRTDRRGLAAWSALVKTVFVGESYWGVTNTRICVASSIITRPRCFVQWECCPFVVDSEDQLQVSQASIVAAVRSKCDRSGRL